MTAAALYLFFCCFNLYLALLPLMAFVLISLLAPFFPSWQFFLPIVTRARFQIKQVALSFDDGPDPLVTPQLLDLLDRYKIKAAFFVIGTKAETYNQIIMETKRRGHLIGNHSYSHDHFLMLRSPRRLYKDILNCQEILRRSGVNATYFRPPVGISNPRLAAVLARIGMDCICFSLRAYDFGNRYISFISQRILARVKPGDIILLHDTLASNTKNQGELWLCQIDTLISGLLSRGFEIVRLDQLIEPATSLSLCPVDLPLSSRHG